MSLLDQAKSMFKSSKEEVIAQVSRFKNRKFMEGTVSVCAYISMASNGASSEEKSKMIQFIEQSKELNVFDTKEVITFFEDRVKTFAFDHDVGKGEAMKFIMQLKEQPNAAQLALRVGISVAKSDGDFDPQEKAAAHEICVALGLEPKDFQL